MYPKDFLRAVAESSCEEDEEDLLASGANRLLNMPTKFLEGEVEKVTIEDLPRFGQMKGGDIKGRSYLFFAVCNPRFQRINDDKKDGKLRCVEEVALIFILETDGRFWMQSEEGFAIPTMDERITSTKEVDQNTIAAVREIFANRHPDLQLCSVDPSIEARSKRFEQRLEAKEFAALSKEIRKKVDKFREKLVAEEEKSRKRRSSSVASLHG